MRTIAVVFALAAALIALAFAKEYQPVSGQNVHAPKVDGKDSFSVDSMSNSSEMSSADSIVNGKKAPFVSKSGDAKAKPHENDDGREPYLVSLGDDATDEHFHKLSQWMKSKSIIVTETFNESYAKFLVASLLREDVTELEKIKSDFDIESIELDGLVWSETEHSEL